MDFEIVIDASLIDLGIASESATTENEYLVSIVNDFEDGKWRFEKFQNFIWDNIAETALSAIEREALELQPSTLLTAAAKNLRLTDGEIDFSKGSELAEIVLYGIMKHKFKALPVVPKIFYKQNVNDNAKGADSVHIVLKNDSDFTLWFGEAKFYKSIEDIRLPTIIESVKNSLSVSKLRKENSIITNVSDLDHLPISDDLKEQMKSALSNSISIDSIKPRLNVPILLLHQCEITDIATEINCEYLKKIRDYHKNRATAYFSKQIETLKDVHMYEKICFHLILFPVPKKEPIIDKFVSTVTMYRN